MLTVTLDVETTGLEGSDRICAVGMVMDESIHYELIHPGKKIPPAASAIHHITNEMVENALPFGGAKSADLIRSLNNGDVTLISHNAPFDLGMLQKEGIVWQGEVIDTLKCSKALMDDLDGYALQFLRYELRLYRQEALLFERYGASPMAHNALSDALHTRMVYEYLLDLASHEKLVELSQSRLLLLRLPFGKYAKKRIETVAMKDPSYLKWMLENMMDMDEDLRYSIEHYLRG